jgi:hypothetical protein
MRFTVAGGHRHFFSDGKVVVLWILPVDQPDGDGLLAHPGTDLHSVSEHSVNIAVGIVERLGAANRFGLAQLVQHPADDLAAVPLSLQPIREIALLDVAIALVALPVTEVFVAQFVPEETDDVLLGVQLALTDVTHA